MPSKNFIFFFLLSIFAKISKLAKIALEILLHLCLKRMQVFFGICWLILYAHVCTFPCSCSCFSINRIYSREMSNVRRETKSETNYQTSQDHLDIMFMATLTLGLSAPTYMEIHFDSSSLSFHQQWMLLNISDKKISGSFETAVKAPIERCESLNFSRCLPRPTSGTGNVLVDKSERWYRS